MGRGKGWGGEAAGDLEDQGGTALQCVCVCVSENSGMGPQHDQYSNP